MWLLQSDWLVRVERRVDWKLLLLNRSRPVMQSNRPSKGTYFLSADLTTQKKRKSNGFFLLPGSFTHTSSITTVLDNTHQQIEKNGTFAWVLSWMSRTGA